MNTIQLYTVLIECFLFGYSIWRFGLISHPTFTSYVHGVLRITRRGRATGSKLGAIVFVFTTELFEWQTFWTPFWRPTTDITYSSRDIRQTTPKTTFPAAHLMEIDTTKHLTEYSHCYTFSFGVYQIWIFFYFTLGLIALTF